MKVDHKEKINKAKEVIKTYEKQIANHYDKISSIEERIFKKKIELLRLQHKQANNLKQLKQLALLKIYSEFGNDMRDYYKVELHYTIEGITDYEFLDSFKSREKLIQELKECKYETKFVIIMLLLTDDSSNPINDPNASLEVKSIEWVFDFFKEYFK